MLGRILLTFGGVLVVALFAALLAPFFVDWSAFRVEFEQRASRILGKKVTVHGEVEVSLLPFPSVTLNDVRVGQEEDGRPQITSERFSMDMELAPFLSGEARIFDMRIERPRARIRILPDGTLDWMRGSSGDIPLRTVVIEDVHITGGTVELIDEQSGHTRRLTGLNADLSAGSLAGPWRGEGYGSLDGEEAAFSLSTGEADRTAHSVPLRLRLLPDAAPVALTLDGNLALSEDRPGFTGRFALDSLEEEDETEPVHAPTPGPRLKGDFELTNERIRIPQYRLEVGALDDPYVVTGEATLDTGKQPDFLLTAEGQQIDVNRLGSGERAKTGRDAAATAHRNRSSGADSHSAGAGAGKLPAAGFGGQRYDHAGYSDRCAPRWFRLDGRELRRDITRTDASGSEGRADAGEPHLLRWRHAACLEPAVGACRLVVRTCGPGNPSVGNCRLLRTREPDAGAAEV